MRPDAGGRQPIKFIAAYLRSPPARTQPHLSSAHVFEQLETSPRKIRPEFLGIEPKRPWLTIRLDSGNQFRRAEKLLRILQDRAFDVREDENTPFRGSFANLP